MMMVIMMMIDVMRVIMIMDVMVVVVMMSRNGITVVL